MPFRYETFVNPETGTVFKHGVYEEEAPTKTEPETEEKTET
jgi:hypothetical protein